MRKNGSPERQTEYWEEGLDLKRLALCMWKKAWRILALSLAGALLGAALYLALRAAAARGPQYRTEVLFAIRYDIREEDETLKAFINEYNAYTWGDVMRSDPVICRVMEKLPQVDRAVLEASVDTAIASDPEFLTAGFTAPDAAQAEKIRDAYVGAMAAFGETMKDRGLMAIEAWKTSPAVPVEKENRVLYAMELGAILGLLAGGLWLAACCVLDDSLLLASDIERRYACPVLGYRTGRSEAGYDLRLREDLEYLSRRGAYREIPADSLLQPGTDWDALRHTAVVLLAKWGTPCLRTLELVIRDLRAQEVTLAGVIVSEADEKFLDRYYGFGFPKRSRENDGAHGAKRGNGE